MAGLDRYPPLRGGIERIYNSNNGRAPIARTAGPWDTAAAARRQELQHLAPRNNKSREYMVLAARAPRTCRRFEAEGNAEARLKAVYIRGAHDPKSGLR